MLVPRQIAAITKLAAKESTRYAFNGVLLQRQKDGRARALATDGRRAIIAEWEESDAAEYPPVDGFLPARVDNFSAIVPCEDFERITKALPKRTPKPILENFTVSESDANGTIRLGCTDLSRMTTFCATTIEGSFPPVDDVVPDYRIINVLDNAKSTEHKQRRPGWKTPAVRVGVNPELLAGCLKAVGAIGCSEESKGVELIVSADPRKPILIRAGRADGSKATAVLMPVNLSA